MTKKELKTNYQAKIKSIEEKEEELEKEKEEIKSQYKIDLRNLKREASPKDEEIYQKRKDLRLPIYTKGEEIFNAVSHIAGGGLAIIMLIVACYFGTKKFSTIGFITCFIYGISAITLYTMSAIYHFLNVNKAKQVFQVLDHCTIYVLIVGTYLPVCVLALDEIAPYNYLLFALVALLAICGIALNATMMKKIAVKIVSYTLYLIIGWIIVFFTPFLLDTMGLNGVIFLILGGASYTIGAILYAIGSKKAYFHSIFHLFVILGTVLQFLGITSYLV